MATVKGIEVSGTTYDIEDETSRNGVTANEEAIGDLSDLETTVKTDLVSAVNEANEKAELAEQLDGNYITQRTRLDNLSASGTGVLSGQGFTREYGEYSDAANISLGESILNFDEIEIECNDSLLWSNLRVNNYTSLARRIIKLLPMVTSLDYGYCQEVSRTVYINSSGDAVATAKNSYRMAFTANDILSVEPLLFGAADSDSDDNYFPQLTSVFKIWGIKHIKVE